MSVSSRHPSPPRSCKVSYPLLVKMLTGGVTPILPSSERVDELQDDMLAFHEVKHLLGLPELMALRSRIRRQE